MFYSSITAVSLVPFLSYSASNNGVTLKSGLGLVQGHGKWYRSKALVQFPIHIPARASTARRSAEWAGVVSGSRDQK